MYGTVAPVCGQELRERVTEIVTDKRGDDIFVTQWDDEQVASPGGVKIVLPARAGMSARLRVNRGWRMVLLIFL